MKILIIGSNDPEKTICAFSPEHIGQIKKILPDAQITMADDPQEINRTLTDADILIYDSGGFLAFDQLKISDAKKLAWVHATSAGVTDFAKILTKTNILLTNSSGVHPIPISETVLGYMLMFSRKLNLFYRNQIESKKWTRDRVNLRGEELAGKTVGIVGYGRIGSEIGKICAAVGMKVAGFKHDNKVNSEIADFVFDNVSKLLPASDFIVDALPLTPETQGYFDKNKFEQMSESAYFINIGRGKTVVEKDLIKALKNGIIAGAGLDVFEVEPLPETSELWKLPNVILTPHISGWSPNYANRVINIFCDNLKAYLENQTMPTLVDKNRGY